MFINNYILYQQQHPFNGPLSSTTQVSRNQKGKTNLNLLEQEIVSGSGTSWAIICTSPKTTMPETHHSVLYRLDALPVTQPTVLKHLRQYYILYQVCKN